MPNQAAKAESKFRIETTTGITVGHARGQKPYSSAGRYSPGGALFIVIGEDLAEKGLNNVFEGLFRGALNASTENLAIAEGRGETILNTPTDDYPNMGDYLKGLLRQSDKRGFIPATTLHQFEMIQAPGKNPIMPLIKLKDKKVEVTGTAIFNKDRMTDKANLTETRSLMLLRGIRANGNIAFIINEKGQIIDKGSVDVKNSRKVTVEGSPDNITFLIEIKLEGNLVEHSSTMTFIENIDLRNRIEKQIASDMKKECEEFIEKMQESYQVDCIDVSKYALAKWGKTIENTIDDKTFIQNAVMNVEVEMKLKSIGELN